MKQEDTKQAELQEMSKRLDIEKIQITNQEKRLTMEKEVESAKLKAQYQMQLELQRDEEKFKKQQAFMDENRRKEEQSIERQEQLKRSTIEYEYQKKVGLEKDLIGFKQRLKLEDARKKVQEQKELIAIKEAERRETLKNVISTSINSVGQGIGTLFSSPKMMARLFGSVFFLYLAMQTSKTILNLSSSIILSRFGKPRLVRDTSRMYVNKLAQLPVLAFRGMKDILTKKNANELMKGVILNPDLEAQLKVLSYSVLNRKKHYAPFRNFMFF